MRRPWVRSVEGGACRGLVVRLSYTSRCLESRDTDVCHGVQGVAGEGSVSKNTGLSAADPCGGKRAAGARRRQDVVAPGAVARDRRRRVCHPDV
jgi:hypothetical protein